MQLHVIEASTLSKKQSVLEVMFQTTYDTGGSDYLRSWHFSLVTTAAAAAVIITHYNTITEPPRRILERTETKHVCDFSHTNYTTQRTVITSRTRHLRAGGGIPDSLPSPELGGRGYFGAEKGTRTRTTCGDDRLHGG